MFWSVADRDCNGRLTIAGRLPIMPNSIDRSLRFAFDLTLRLIESARIPAVRFTLSETKAWFSVSLKDKLLLAAPSKRQMGAMRSALHRHQIAHYSLLFGYCFREGRDVIVDVGANIGYSALAFAKAAKIAGNTLPRQILVEPNSRNFPFIRRNLKTVKGWDLLPLGLGRQTGFLRAGIPAYNRYRGTRIFMNTGLVTVRPDVDILPSTSISLPIVEVEVLLAFAPRPTEIAFCKIDVEGGELDVLQGLATWFKAKVIFEIEVNPLYQSSDDVNQIISLLESHGYSALSNAGTKETQTSNWLLVPNELAATIGSSLSMTTVIQRR